MTLTSGTVFTGVHFASRPTCKLSIVPADLASVTSTVTVPTAPALGNASTATLEPSGKSNRFASTPSATVPFVGALPCTEAEIACGSRFQTRPCSARNIGPNLRKAVMPDMPRLWSPEGAGLHQNNRTDLDNCVALTLTVTMYFERAAAQRQLRRTP